MKSLLKKTRDQLDPSAMHLARPFGFQVNTPDDRHQPDRVRHLHRDVLREDNDREKFYSYPSRKGPPTIPIAG